MINPKTFFITEARANIFKIFQMVAEGQEVIIIKKDSNERFKVSLIDQKPQKNRLAIAKSMAKSGFKSLPIEEMKKILNTRSDLWAPSISIPTSSFI